jgi:hypothetical protein
MVIAIFLSFPGTVIDRKFAETALCAKGQGLPLGRKLSQFFLFFCLGRITLNFPEKLSLAVVFPAL